VAVKGEGAVGAERSMALGGKGRERNAERLIIYRRKEGRKERETEAQAVVKKRHTRAYTNIYVRGGVKRA